MAKHIPPKQRRSSRRWFGDVGIYLNTDWTLKEGSNNEHEGKM